MRRGKREEPLVPGEVRLDLGHSRTPSGTVDEDGRTSKRGKGGSRPHSVPISGFLFLVVRPGTPSSVLLPLTH